MNIDEILNQMEDDEYMVIGEFEITKKELMKALEIVYGGAK